MTVHEPSDPVVAACMTHWDVPAEAVKVRWLEDDVVFAAHAQQNGERVSTVGAVSGADITLGAVAAETALLEYWPAHRPTPTAAADALSTVAGLDSVHRVTERMPDVLYPPRASGTDTIEFWAVLDDEELMYFNFTVHFPENGPAQVEQRPQ